MAARTLNNIGKFVNVNYLITIKYFYCLPELHHAEANVCLLLIHCAILNRAICYAVNKKSGNACFLSKNKRRSERLFFRQNTLGNRGVAATA